MTLLEQYQRFRLGGAVERCHTVPHHGSYNNAAHSWGVAMLMRLLWPEDFERLVIYCLSHDIPEAWTGDIPAPMKRDPHVNTVCSRIDADIFSWLGLPNPDVNLSLLDRAKLKACDHLELFVWALEQRACGNAYAQSVINALMSFYANEPMLSPANQVFHELKVIGISLPVIQEIRKA